MEATRHEGDTLRYIVIHPDGYDPAAEYPLVILLHGFGANMADLASLAPAIDQESYIYVCPNAPIPFDLGGGAVGYGWMPPRGTATPDDIRRAEDGLQAFIGEVMGKYPTPPGKVILGGFSQGGGMTYRCGLGKPETFAGLAVLSGFLPNPEDLRPKLPSARNQPIFIAHGVYDDLAPLEAAQKARDFLEGAGYAPAYKEYPIRHEISPDVVADLTSWMRGALESPTPSN